MFDDMMKNFLASQCLDFSKHLASQGHFFKFSLKKKTFSFNLEIMETRKPTTVNKKKESPSTLARNARRKEDFLAKKRSATSDKIEKEKAAVEDPTAIPVDKDVDLSVKEIAAMEDPIAILVDRDEDLSKLCEFCEFLVMNSAGLEVHMTRRHKTISQIDGITEVMKDSDFMKDTDVTESEVEDVSANDVSVINCSSTREKVPVLLEDSRDAESRGLEEINNRREKVVTSLPQIETTFKCCHTSGVVFADTNYMKSM